MEKLWKMLESIEIIKLSQQKDEKLFGPRTKLPYYKVYHTKNKKKEIFMNKPVYLGLSILELSKILMYMSCGMII